jgi:hypothetical protein
MFYEDDFGRLCEIALKVFRNRANWVNDGRWIRRGATLYRAIKEEIPVAYACRERERAAETRGRTLHPDESLGKKIERGCSRICQRIEQALHREYDKENDLVRLPLRAYEENVATQDRVKHDGALSGKATWKPTVLTFLMEKSGRATFREIADHAINLVKAGTLSTRADTSDRLQLDANVAQALVAMKKSGEVTQSGRGRPYLMSEDGLAWLKEYERGGGSEDLPKAG